MEEIETNDLDFYDMELSVLVSSLQECFRKQQDNFVYICKDVYRIWKYCKGKYFLSKSADNESYNSYGILAKFGFDKKAVGRYKNCYLRFIVDNGTTLALNLLYAKFSPSKLYELLPLSATTSDSLVSNGTISYQMTVKQIREIVKETISGKKQTETVEELEDEKIDEEEIPMVYDPKQEYEFSYFESKTKSQLLNIIWELQKEYQKLKKQKEKKNVKQENK